MDSSVIVGMAAARPGHPFRHLRLAGVLAVTAALGTSGIGLAQDPNAGEGGPTPPPFVAESYDIGGRSLFMVCVGPADSTLPTVIAEAPLGGDQSAFESLGPLLAEAPLPILRLRSGWHGEQ